MKRKLISYICLMAIFMESVPVSALSNIASETIPLQSVDEISESSTEDEKSNGEDKVLESTKEDENLDNDTEENAESPPKLEDNIFNMYILGKRQNEEELGFSIGFDEKESKFIVSNQSEKQLSKENLDTIIYKINIYDKENKEKLNIELLGSDSGNSEKLNILKETKYEIGDTIKIDPFDAKNGLKILGSIQGDIDKQKEDYSDGVDNIDCIENVRFEITETNLKSIYNEAPVINGLSDINNSKDPNLDILKDISVTDDHDGKIDNSNIVTNIEKINDNSLKVTYTVKDSWGRETSGTRTISKENSKPLNESNNYNSSSTRDIEISVGGVSYGSSTTSSSEERFKIKIDTASDSIKITNQDGRLMSNIIDGEYFKFELYDRTMKLKESVTLLGRDKSNSDKLKNLNNLKYIDGDYIYIWHAESSTKLKINGTIEKIENSAENYTDGIDEEHLINHRFRISSNRLIDVFNTAPVIHELSPITVSRGQKVDLLTGINITDDHDLYQGEDESKGKVEVSVTDVNTNILGDHTVTYTATDSWGLSSTATRKIIVSGTNPLESKFIEIYSHNKDTYELAFKIGFDAVEETYTVTDINNECQLDSTTDSIVLKIRIFSKDGILKKTLNIKGKDIIDSSLLSKIDGFKYTDGDYIELWSSNPKNSIKIIGDVDNTINENIDTNVEVNLDNGIPEDYSNGIDNVDYMNNVRFRINHKSEESKYSLEAVYNKAPVFSFDEMTVKRGEIVENLLQGVYVEDDHDNYTSEDLIKKVSYGKLNTDKVGNTTIDYRITDSWGRTTIAIRTITVIDNNTLETQQINVKSNGNIVFSLSFDSILKKFIVKNINLDNLDDNIDGNIFRMRVYGPKNARNGANLECKSQVIITSDDLQNNKFTSKFEDLSFEEGYYISLWSYDYENGIDIKFAEDNIYTFEYDDEMHNTRFKITEDGLEEKYNYEPQIHGIDTKYIFKGNGQNVFDPLDGVYATDDIDGDISKEKIEVTEINELDVNTIGDYVLEYTVQDSWGRSTSLPRHVHVVSKSVSNYIELYDNNDQEIFSLRYNPDRGRFDVTRTDIRTTGVENREEKVFRLDVFNNNSEKVGSVEIKDSDLDDNAKLDEILELDMQDDYYFSIWSYNPSKIKIQGDLLGDENNKKEDYHDGIQEEDHMINVRFRVTQAGFECVYNNAPEIHGLKDLIVYAGDVIDYLNTDDDGDSNEEDITITDDHDRSIDKSKIKITNNNDEPLDNVNDTGKLSIGENIIKYTVEDSWGRKTTETITLTIKEGMGKHTIRLQGGPDINTHQDRIIIGFNSETKKLNITQVNEVINNGMSNSHIYYRISIIKVDGETIGPIEIRGKQTGSQVDLSSLQGDNYTFEYGDKIKIFAWHPNRVKMDGKIIDSREDYTDGFDIPMNLLNVEFEITHSGLRSIYTESLILEDGETNIFAPIAPEGYPIKYAVVPDENDGGKLVAYDTGQYSILHEEGNNPVLRMAIYDSNGNLRRHDSSGNIVESGGNQAIATFNGNGRDYGNFRNKKYRNGDYLYLQHKYSKRMSIYGNVEGYKEDYSDGFEEELDMRNTIFRFTENGLQAVYNEAPIINGIEDTTVYLGENFEPLENVTLTDNDTVSTNGEIEFNSNVETDRIGEYEVVYTVRDNWGRVTTQTRKVRVVPRLNDNRFKIYADKEFTDIISISQDESNNGESNDNNTNVEGGTTIEDIPAFEIGFDPVTSKYKVYNQKSDRLSEYNIDGEVFYIVIRDDNNHIKADVTLTGNDRGTSPKLNIINTIDYEYGDTIEIYREDYQNGIKISGNITGDTNGENYNNGISSMDSMLNTRFEVGQEGLKAIYNNSPQIQVDSLEKTIIKGNTDNLLQGIRLIDNDEHDSNLSEQNISIYLEDEPIDNNYVFNKLGKYTLNYYIVDNWGRSCLKQVGLSVESRVNLNDINVYHNNSIGLKIGFDTKSNNIVVKSIGSNTKSVNDETNYFTMTVRDRKGTVKYLVSLNGNIEHDTQQLAQIHNQRYSRYDSISLYGANPDTVRIDGDIVEKTIDYANGFGSIDKYNEVRFVITDDGFKEISQYIPTLSGLDKITLKRGDSIDFMDGVSVNTQGSFDEDYKITVNENGFDNLTEGTYTVIYNVQTSWGVNKNYNRIVEVEPRNELEKVKMVVNRRNSSTRKSNNILTIGFDSINNKLRIINAIENHPMPGNSSDIALRLTAYNESGNTVGSIELHGNDVINNDFITRINNFKYHQGYSLSVWYSDYENLSIEGKIKNQKINYSNGVTNPDYIENVRFTITDEGLVSTYNEAPKIKGCEDELIHYKGNVLDPFNGISIEDDHDKNLGVYDITYDDSDVDLDTVGRYTIRYTIEDTWGRKSKVYERDVVVKSALALNNIEIYAIGNTSYSLGKESNRVFGISFDEGIVKINNRQNIAIDSPSGDNKVLSIKVYNNSMEVVKNVELNGNDTGNSNKLDELHNYRLNSDEFLSLEDMSANFAKNGIKISGKVVSEKENYEDGIDKIEEIKNTRFKLTEYGLEAIYNTAPKIIIDGPLNALLGDEIDYMKGITLEDDHDKLGKANVTVSELPNGGMVGVNEVTYTVTDSWGASTEITRIINLENALPYNKIQLTGHPDPNKIEENVQVALEVTFDISNPDNMVLRVSEGKDMYFRKGNNNKQYQLQLLDTNGGVVATRQVSGNDKANNPNLLFRNFDGLRFEYGYKIKLFAWHQDLLRIEGRVRNAKEDYSDGVQQGDSYTMATFEITPKGLVADYGKDPEINNDNYVTILPSAREGYPFGLRINLQTNQIEAIKRTRYSIEFSDIDHQDALLITLYDENGNIKTKNNGTQRILRMSSKMNPTDNYGRIQPIEGEFSPGDYITISHRTPKNLSIVGTKTNFTGWREDYSDGIDEVENMTTLILRLDENGVRATYDDPPTIEGVVDRVKFKFEEITKAELLENVTAHDPLGGTLSEISVTFNANYTDNIGLYDIIYTVTNSKGISTTVTSTLEVQAKPVITVNEDKTTVELDSVENTFRAIENYLINEVVSVFDEEDSLKGVPVKLEINGTFNPSEEGSQSTITYTATDSNNNRVTQDVVIRVTRTINVSVPTTIPFQVVTNLKDKEADPFISGVMKIKNYNTSEVDVFIESFTKKENSGELELVDPTEYDWDTLSSTEAMKKMALGMYVKSGLTSESPYVKEDPLWLIPKSDINTGISDIPLGIIPRAESLGNPSECKLSFTSKHGRNFIGGRSKGKFSLVFRFE